MPPRHHILPAVRPLPAIKPISSHLNIKPRVILGKPLSLFGGHHIGKSPVKHHSRPRILPALKSFFPIKHTIISKHRPQILPAIKHHFPIKHTGFKTPKIPRLSFKLPTFGHIKKTIKPKINKIKGKLHGIFDRFKVKHSVTKFPFKVHPVHLKVSSVWSRFKAIAKKKFHSIPLKFHFFWGRFIGRGSSDADNDDFDHDTCMCTGDPHCSSLDGKRFDYQGTCEYRMFKTPSGFQPSVDITTKLDHVGRNKRVSYNRIVRVKVENYTIIINGIEHFVKVCDDGSSLDDCEGVVDDYYIEEHNVTIEKEGSNPWRSRVTVNIKKAGIKVKFNQWRDLIIDISTKYKNDPNLSRPDIEGFCGNYNGNRADDGEDINALAQHAKVGGGKLCMKTTSIDGIKADTKTKLICKKIFSEDLPRVLKNVIPGYRCKVNMDDIPKQIKNCAIDMTLSSSNDRCQVLANQLSDCVVSWREELGCPMKCPANSRYIFNKPKFVSTCVMPVPLNASRIEGEGCLCDEGYLQSNDLCLKPTECGCFTKGNYRENGQNWIQRVLELENGKNITRFYKYECNSMKPKRIRMECKSSDRCFFKQPAKKFVCCPASGCKHQRGSGCGEMVEIGVWQEQNNDGFYDPVDLAKLAIEVDEASAEEASMGSANVNDSNSASISRSSSRSSRRSSSDSSEEGSDESSDESSDDSSGSDSGSDSEEGHDTCQCTGDPHCITLDGKKFNYQGTCEYRMFKTPPGSDLDVEIKTKLGHIGKKSKVSFNRIVTVTVGDYHIILNGVDEYVKACDGDIESDDCEGVTNEYNIEEHGVTVERVGRVWRKSRITVSIEKVGITVYFNRWRHLVIDIPAKFRNNPDLNRPDIQGFCGNYNGDSSDDVIDLDTLASNAKTGGEDGCLSTVSVEKVKVDIKAQEICKMIYEKDLPEILKHKTPGHRCKLRLRKVDKLIHNCGVDMTLTGVFDRCEVLENELTDCIISWRDRLNCPMKCPANSKYVFDKPRRVPTCVKPRRIGKKIAGEGCLCNKGYLESNEQCVKPSECGCLVKGTYKEFGEVWIQRIRVKINRRRRLFHFYRYHCEKSGPKRIRVGCQKSDKCFFKQPGKQTICCPKGGCKNVKDSGCGAILEIGKWEFQQNDGGYEPIKYNVTDSEPSLEVEQPEDDGEEEEEEEPEPVTEDDNIQISEEEEPELVTEDFHIPEEEEPELVTDVEIPEEEEPELVTDVEIPEEEEEEPENYVTIKMKGRRGGRRGKKKPRSKGKPHRRRKIVRDHVPSESDDTTQVVPNEPGSESSMSGPRRTRPNKSGKRKRRIPSGKRRRKIKKVRTTLAPPTEISELESEPEILTTEPIRDHAPLGSILLESPIPELPDSKDQGPPTGDNSGAIVDMKGEKMDEKYYRETINRKFTYPIVPHEIVRGIARATATSFTTYTKPYQAMNMHNIRGWMPELQTKEQQCITLDLGSQVNIHGVASSGGRWKGKCSFVKRYTVYVSRDGEEWQLMLKKGTKRERAFLNKDCYDVTFHCLHKYYGNPFEARYVRACIIPEQYENYPMMKFIVYGFRKRNDLAHIMGMMQDRNTVSVTGCQCYWDLSLKSCACCLANARQCSSSYPYQCVRAGDAAMCGSVDAFPKWSREEPMKVRPSPTEDPSEDEEQPLIICAEDQVVCPTDPTKCKDAGSLRCIEAEIPDPEIQLEEADAISGLLDISDEEAQGVVADSLVEMEEEDGAPTEVEPQPTEIPSSEEDQDQKENTTSPGTTPSIECICPPA